MFSSEIYGYNKNEVDKYLLTIKAEHEKSIMDEKLKVLEAEKKVLEMKKKSQEVELREKKILNVLESYRKLQAEGNRNIDVLRSEQLRMVYYHLQSFMRELDMKYPGILVNSSYKKLITEIEAILDNTLKSADEVGGDNDPMRMLLNKMQEKKVLESSREIKEIKIERTDSKEKIERPSLIKPVTQMQLEKDDKYDNLVDKFLDSAPVEEPKKLKIQSSGFDLKEAVNPKEDLSEIMKAFDFYNNEDEQK